MGRRDVRAASRRWVYMKAWRIEKACGLGRAMGRTGRVTAAARACVG
jgi:hypothetical protein